MTKLNTLARLLTGWTDYDPQWLIALARAQHQDKKWLEEAFAECISAKVGKAYVYFVSSSNPNQLGSEWQFEQNLILDHPIRGEIVVDILKGNRIGGIELLKEL